MGKKAWSGIKKFGSDLYDFGGKIVHGVAGAAHWVDNALTSLHDIPLVGELAGLLQNNSIYRDILGVVNTVEKGYNDVGKVGRAIAGVVDSIPGINNSVNYGAPNMGKGFNVKLPSIAPGYGMNLNGALQTAKAYGGLYTGTNSSS